jgi:putative OPT family oligopeptide transporter
LSSRAPRPLAAVGVESSQETASRPITSAPSLERTTRALVTGCGIGVVLAAGNVYTGLKTSFIDGGSITAALLAFMLFASARPLAALENNIVQTTASSAAIMGFVTGLAGPVPALSFLGVTLPGWAIAVWGTAVGMVGILAGTLLRRKLIVEAALPFPTGGATAEVIETISAARETAARRAVLLAISAAVAMAVTWFRDGRPSFIPQSLLFGGTIGGIAAGALSLGVSCSPLMVATGAMIGVRAAASMAIGAVASWAVLAPWLVRQGIVHEASFGAVVSWMVWPGLGLLVAGSFVPLLLDGGAVVRSFRDLGSFLRRAGRAGGTAAEAGAAAPDPAARAPRALAPLVGASVVVIVVVARVAFGVPPLVIGLAIVLALVLGNVSGRSAGETDLAPVGQVGMLTQLVFAGWGSLVTVVAGWLSMGVTSQAAQTLWAFRAGQRLGASPRAQVGAQVLGALVGGAVVVPVYWVIVKSYGIGTEAMPAAAAQSWKATALALESGLRALPAHGPLAGAIGLGLGTALTLLARTRAARFVPSPAAMGMAMLISASLSFTAFAGALAVVFARRLRPSLDEPTVMALAAGGIAGESVMGVIVAALIASGLF